MQTPPFLADRDYTLYAIEPLACGHDPHPEFDSGAGDDEIADA